MNVVFTDNDFVVFTAVDFGDKKVNKVQFDYVSGSKKGKFEIRENDKRGRLLAIIATNTATGSLNKQTISIGPPELSGKKNIAIVFKGKAQDAGSLNWFLFDE